MNYLSVFLIILIIIFLYNKLTKNNENFTSCANCGYFDELECGSCPTCGFCIAPDGSGECVPGDINGPYFRSDCMIWKHPHQFKRYLPRFYGRRFHHKKIEKKRII